MNCNPLLAVGLGTPEIILLICLVILLFGAKKLPELARGLGKAKSEFQKASQEAEREFQNASESTPPAKKPTEPTSTPGNN